MKLGDRMGHGAIKDPLKLGADPDKGFIDHSITLLTMTFLIFPPISKGIMHGA